MSALLQQARQISAQAYAPYSKFQVGAAILLADGRIVTGYNQENAAYSMCLCAERVAMAAVWNDIRNGNPIVRMAIASPAAPSGLTPCGACRQVMAEAVKIQGVDFTVETGDNVSFLVSDLLPAGFSL